MARYALNLPETLKSEAQSLANREGVSLNQLILWAVADRVGACAGTLKTHAFPT